MDTLWLALAAMIECVGALIIVAHAVRALGIVLRGRETIDRAKSTIADGAITGLDFKLAATLLKTMTLLAWHQIGMFAALYAIRFLLKQAFRREQQAATPRARPISSASSCR